LLEIDIVLQIFLDARSAREERLLFRTARTSRPSKLRELPAGRYVVEAVDENAPALSQEDFCERREHMNDRRSRRRGSIPAMNCAKSSLAASRASSGAVILT
jgi:hypothetical protein